MENLLSDDLENVELTHEWLLKFGFKAHKEKDGTTSYRKRQRGIYMDVFERNGKFFGPYNGYAYAIKLHSIQQLQALWFGVMQQPLIIEK